MHRPLLILCCFLPFILNAQYKFSGSFGIEGIANNSKENPFWVYANKNGRITPSTNILGIGTANFHGIVDNNNHFSIGAGFLATDGQTKALLIDEMFAKFRHHKVQLKAGAWHRKIKMNDLSSSGGDIIWSGNARALPGLVLSLEEGVPLADWVSFRASLGHYFLTEDRFVRNAQLHYKNIRFDFDLNPRDRLQVELDHYAQYGGVSKTYGPQPSSFSDYLKIFTGSSGGSKARESDQANALGNHLGSYTFSYSMIRYDYDLKIYHQNIFEDRSGMEFNNFPDGVWGLYLQPKGIRFLKAFLYEYVQTVSQSGRFFPPPNGNFRGGDNYFSNGMYQSGWTYKRRIIGTPFIVPNENNRGIKINRSYVQHLGILGIINKLTYKVKASYVKNLGTYNKPLDEVEEAYYSYLGLEYPVLSGNLNAQLAFDLSNTQANRYGISLGYNISF